MLVRAKSVTFQSTSGVYLTTTLFPKLGIAAVLAAKTNDAGPPAVASGEVEIAIQPVSELVHAAGVDYVGPIPEDIQFVSVFSAAIVSGSNQVDASRRLLSFLASAAADSAIQNAGMQRATRR